MSAALIAQRGPTINCTSKRGADQMTERVEYEADTIILLQEGNIVDFGPARKLLDKLSSDTKVELFDRCRIIKTLIP